MITKRRCPHTGIVNFFSHTDPLLAVGSVSRERAPSCTRPSRQTPSHTIRSHTTASHPTASHYVWRSYLDDRQSGIAPDIAVAEAHLRDAIARRPNPRPDRF